MAGPTAGLAGEAAALVCADPGEWSLAELEAGVADLARTADQVFAVQMRVLAAVDARCGGARRRVPINCGLAGQEHRDRLKPGRVAGAFGSGVA
jgi:hypothetical protein